MYPDGIAAEIDLYHGTHINPPDFVKVAECVGGYGEQVTDPEKLQDALKRGLEANQNGKGHCRRFPSLHRRAAYAHGQLIPPCSVEEK